MGCKGGAVVQITKRISLLSLVGIAILSGGVSPVIVGICVTPFVAEPSSSGAAIPMLMVAIARAAAPWVIPTGAFGGAGIAVIVTMLACSRRPRLRIVFEYAILVGSAGGAVIGVAAFFIESGRVPLGPMANCLVGAVAGAIMAILIAFWIVDEARQSQ